MIAQFFLQRVEGAGVVVAALSAEAVKGSARIALAAGGVALELRRRCGGPGPVRASGDPGGNDIDILSFRGRANRMDFWMVSIGLTMLHLIFAMLAGLIVGMVFQDALTPGQKVVGAEVFALAIQLLFLWPITAVAVRRSHDRNMSGWWYGAYALFELAARFLGLLLMVQGVKPEGGSGALISAIIACLEIGLWLTFLVILGFLPGTRGANRFGPPPNSRHENYRAPPVE